MRELLGRIQSYTNIRRFRTQLGIATGAAALDALNSVRNGDLRTAKYTAGAAIIGALALRWLPAAGIRRKDRGRKEDAPARATDPKTPEIE